MQLFFRNLGTVVIFALLVFFAVTLGSDFFQNEWQMWQDKQVLGTADERGFEQVQVSRVIDGDTVELSDGRRVRYIGIDTPETRHPTQADECFGSQASDFNQQLVENELVQLEKDVSETDRYGRLLRYVWLKDQLVNRVLVEEGYALASSYPPDVTRQIELNEAQRQARIASKGLWGQCPLADNLSGNEASPSAEPSVPNSNCPIKGNISDNGQLYHTQDCPSYASVDIDESKGERWFCSLDEATQAGWLKASNCP